MEVGQYDAANSTGQVLGSFVNWGGNGGPAAIGIGNWPGGAGNADYTFTNNSGDYTSAILTVWVNTVPEPSSFMLCGLGAVGLLVAARRRRVVSLAVALAIVMAAYSAPAQAGPVAQESGYHLDYSMDLIANRNAGNSNNSLVYTTDNSGSIPTGSFNRVAYELTLSGSTNPNSPNGNVWVSFNTPSTVASQLGVPTTGSGEFYQQFVSNMNVIATPGTGVTDATGLTNGNIQFWPTNYSANGTTGNFDWNNSSYGGQGYGLLSISQITNPSGSTGNMFISFNNWGSDHNYGGGPGNAPSGSPDYTFQNNIGDYSSAVLTVWVAQTPEPSSFILCGLGTFGLIMAARRRRG